MATSGTAQAGFTTKLKRPFVSGVRFLKDVWAELQRVVWPSHEETYSYTAVVIIAVVVVAIWVGALDMIFTGLVRAFNLYH
jgi:preprotein translocase subunit SecE